MIDDWFAERVPSVVAGAQRASGRMRVLGGRLVSVTGSNRLDLAFFAGLALVAAGVALIYLPAGLITLGALISGCVYVDQRSQQ